MSRNANIDLVKAFIQVEGNLDINSVCTNYDHNGGIKFSGYSKEDEEIKQLEIVMNKNQVEAINSCSSVPEIYDCYKEMEFF